MPFLEDNDADERVLRNPLWSAFALIKDNLERLIALNLFWSLQVLPILAAFAFPVLWLWLRIVLLLVSATALAASTGVLYGAVKYVCEGEPLSLDLFREAWRTYALPSMRKLAPLYGTWGVCLILIVLSLASGLLLLQMLCYYVAMLLVASSFFWGPLFADDPHASSWTLLRRSWQYLWRYPSQVIVSGGVILVILVTGVASIAGIMLIVPVMAALLQTRRYQEVAERERLRHRRRQARQAAMTLNMHHS